MIKNGIGVVLAWILGALCGAGTAVAQVSQATPPEAQEVATAAPRPASEAGFDLAAFSEPGGLTATAAAARARQTSPSLARARAAVVVAEAGADRAWLAVLPRLDLSARYTRLSNVEPGSLGIGTDPDTFRDAAMLVGGVDDVEARLLFETFLAAFQGFSGIEFPVILDQYALRASLSYPVSDLFFTILPAHRASSAFAEAERVRADAQGAAVELSAREAFYAYARARGAHAVAASSVEQVDAQRRQVEALVNAGVAARVDLMRVDALLASARVAEAQVRGGVAVAEHALRTLLHEEGEGRLAIGEDLTATLPAIEGSRQDFVGRALDRRAELRAVRALLRARDHLVSARSGARLPHLGVAANLDFANPNSRVFPQEERFSASWDVSAVLSWSPNDFFTGGQDVRAAEAEEGQARADLEALEDAVRLEVTQAYEGVRSAEGALGAASVGIEAAEESYRVRQEQLRAGTAVTSDLIDAEADVSRARLQLLNALIDLRVARARLERASGDT